jgi:hypothetical protein
MVHRDHKVQQEVHRVYKERHLLFPVLRVQLVQSVLLVPLARVSTGAAHGTQLQATTPTMLHRITGLATSLSLKTPIKNRT